MKECIYPEPTGRVDVVLDTDTYNEIDDQFALSYLALSPEEVTLRAVYAAPFLNERSTGPADGMERSYQEILKLLTLLKREDLKENAFRGSDRYLSDEETPVCSDAMRDLIERSKAYSSEKPLYVVAIGAITNIASALIADPSLKERIVVVWLGGHAHHWPDTHEFNMFQDVAAARVVFQSGVPLVQLPCMGVVTEFRISGPELDAFLLGANPLCDYLATHTKEAVREYTDHPVWSRVIWDVTAAGYVVNPKFFSSKLVTRPIPEYNHTYTFPEQGDPLRYVYEIKRDELMRDMIDKLRSMKQ